MGRAARVSPRTFFNYFTSKEDAVAGRGKPFEPTDEAIDRFVRGTGQVLPDVVELVAESTPSGDDPVVHRLRRRLLEQEPGLLGIQVASAKRFEERVTELIAERLTHDAHGRTPDAGRVRMLGFVAMAVLRTGWSRWVAEEGARPLGDCVRAAYADFAQEFRALPSAPGPVLVDARG